MSTIPHSALLLAVIGSPCPYCGQTMWSAAAAITTKALYRWGNNLRACHALATLAPIMWQRSLSAVQPLRPGLGHQMAPNWGLFGVWDTGQLRARQCMCPAV